MKNIIFPRHLLIKYQEIYKMELEAKRKGKKDLLIKSIYEYEKFLEEPHIPDNVFLTIAERCLRQLKSSGFLEKAIHIHKRLINRFPLLPNFTNDLAVTYITINRLEDAKLLLQKTLTTWPHNGFAQALYGFLLKTKENDLVNAIKYLKLGLDSQETIDNRCIFYFHLGDALVKLGKNNEAFQIYEKGVQENIFLSVYQRSLYNIKRLKGKPWWSKDETKIPLFFNILENNWKFIKDEALALISKNRYFHHETEDLKDTGEWKQFELYSRGRKIEENCKKCPVICKIIDSFPEIKNCRRGQVKLSIIQPGTHIWPHCGPTNCRLRSHLGLKIPKNTFLRVANEIRSWKEGEVLIFDDSFEHEVWHNGTNKRLILIVDFWHPDLTEYEINKLTPI